jgi:hypothetical protein
MARGVSDYMAVNITYMALPLCAELVQGVRELAEVLPLAARAGEEELAKQVMLQ